MELPFNYKKKLGHRNLNTCFILKVQPWKLYHSKYRITTTQITNLEILAIITFMLFCY